MNIAILGSNGFIGNDLLNEFIKEKNNKIFPFSRVNSPNYYQYSDFSHYEYELIINCIGIGAPNGFAKSISNLASFNNKFDQLCIDYLHKHPNTKYVYLSSGSVYGDFKTAPDDNNIIDEKNLKKISGYESVKFSTENFHRELKDLNIYDVRIFNYVSETISLDSGFFVSDIFKATLNNLKINCTRDIFYRDFTSSHDLQKLILHLFENNDNDVIDMYSKDPVSNHELLNFFNENYNLNFTFIDDTIFSPTGVKKNYYSLSRKAQKKYGFYPDYSSIENICNSFNKIKDNF